MFLNYTSGITYMAAKSAIPDKYDGIAYSGPPQPGTSAYPGAALVAQYLESFQFRTGAAGRVQEAKIRAAAQKAAALDEADFDAGAIECVSETCPSLNNLMKAFVELGYAQNTNGVGFVKAAQADVKYFIRQYNGIVLEMKITNTTYNASGFDISSAGSL